MTSKKRRQRGSRTHGGGSHKNRRGAGNRGGRGAAGRAKHEYHKYGPLGKYGFNRPEDAKTEVIEVKVQKLDEDAALYAAEGLAEEDGDAYVFDARDVVEDGYETDVVKVLGGGQVRNELYVTADAFTAGAVKLIEEAGGEASLTEEFEPDVETESDSSSDGVSRADYSSDSSVGNTVAGNVASSTDVTMAPNGGGGSNDLNDDEENESMESERDDPLDGYRERIDRGESLSSNEVREILEEEDRDIQRAYELVIENYRDADLSADDVLNLYELKIEAEQEEIDTEDVSSLLDGYFEDIYDESRVELLQEGIDQPRDIGDVRREVEDIEEAWSNLVEVSPNEPNPNGLETEKKRYLMAVRSSVA